MKTVPRLTLYFLLAMLVLTFLCWKLDALRTPVVETVAPTSGSLSDDASAQQVYDCIIPRQALSRQNNFWYVYVYDPGAEQMFPSSATGDAVRTMVSVRAQQGNFVAIEGYLPDGAQVVLYATCPLQGERIAVWNGEEGLA